jgi:hypothetical protein
MPTPKGISVAIMISAETQLAKATTQAISSGESTAASLSGSKRAIRPS